MKHIDFYHKELLYINFMNKMDDVWTYIMDANIDEKNKKRKVIDYAITF